MLYLDNDYKIDCENKIPYNKMALVESVPTTLKNHIYYYDGIKIWHSNEKPKVYIVKINLDYYDNFWVKDVDFSKEIAPGVFKIIINNL